MRDWTPRPRSPTGRTIICCAGSTAPTSRCSSRIWRRCRASANDLLYNPGYNVETVHFPCGPSLVSYVVPNEDGRDVETILVGREGAVGGIVSHGYLPAYTRICVKFGGPFVRLPVSKLEAAKAKSIYLAQHFRPLRRLHAGADVPVDRLQCRAFDRAAHREMDRVGDGAHRRR